MSLGIFNFSLHCVNILKGKTVNARRRGAGWWLNQPLCNEAVKLNLVLK